MIYFDLLYPCEELRTLSREQYSVSEQLVEDMQLNELICSDIMNEKQFEQLRTEIMYLPTDATIILYRQKVLKDFISYPNFIRDLLELCANLKEKMPEKKYNIFHAPIPIHRKFKEYIDLLEFNYNILYGTKFYGEFNFLSEVLQNVYNFLNNVEYQKNLKEIIQSLREVLEAEAMEISVDYTYGKCMNLVRIKELLQKNVIPMTEGSGWLKKKVIDEDHFIDSAGNYVLSNNMNEIYIKTLLKLCDYTIRVNNSIIVEFKRIYNDSFYYKIGANLKKFYIQQRLPFCMPEISESDNNIRKAKGLYSIILAVKFDKQKHVSYVKDISEDKESEQVILNTVDIHKVKATRKTAEIQKIAEMQKTTEIQKIAEMQKTTEIQKITDIQKIIHTQKTMGIQKVSNIQEADDYEITNNKLQCNNYNNELGNIAIITGINSGGKTVFLQSIGCAQILMQLGFYLPAEYYISNVAPYIGSLFAVSEDVYTIHGKLEQELVCIKKLATSLKPKSLILMNEILASTSEDEGAQIAADVLRAFAKTNSNIIFVTHLYDLAVIAENEELLQLKEDKAVNYITERGKDENGVLRGTYRIIPGKPQKGIWMEELMKKYVMLN